MERYKDLANTEPNFRLMRTFNTAMHAESIGVNVLPGKLRSWGPRPIYHNPIPRRRPATCAQKSLWGHPIKSIVVSTSGVALSPYLNECFCRRCEVAAPWVAMPVTRVRDLVEPVEEERGSATKLAAAGKKRTRTGCLNCRKKRRKCACGPHESREVLFWMSNFKQVTRRSRDVRDVRIDERRANGV